MNKELVYNDLLKIVDKDDIKIDEPMKKHISFRVGGPADILVRPRTEEQLSATLKYISENNLPYLIIGNGSNLLIKDGGIRGIVIEFGDNFNKFEIEGTTIKAQAGALLAAIGKAALRESLTGFECISGIPGSLGGALAMNAGAYGGEIKSVVKSVKIGRASCRERV